MSLYPELNVMIGYSGGMALYIPNWECFEILFPTTILNYN